jgi:hypothetical protein
VWANKGQKRHVAGTLDCHAQGALMSGAGTGLAPRLYLGAFRQISAEPRYVFIVNIPNVVYAEGTHFTAGHIAATGPAGGGRGGGGLCLHSTWLSMCLRPVRNPDLRLCFYGCDFSACIYDSIGFYGRIVVHILTLFCHSFILPFYSIYSRF